MIDVIRTSNANDDTWENNAKYLLERCPHTVRVREGGGPENLMHSFIHTFMAMEQKLRGSHETGDSHSERYRVALQKIIDDGDYTAPEGMKLIAREVLANGTCESRAALDVLAERRRQVTVEGWTPEHDDQHNDSELAEAAVAYASHAASRGWSFADSPDEYRNDRPFPPEKEVFGYGDVTWPKHWSWDWWKPTSPRRDLVKAAALILAEIERLDRHSQKASDECCCAERGGGLVCTLPKGHAGQHEAWGARKNLLQSWPAMKADPPRGAKARDFVEYDPYGGVRVDMARYLRSPAGQAQLALGGKKASERQPCSHGNATGHCQHCLDAL